MLLQYVDYDTQCFFHLPHADRYFFQTTKTSEKSVSAVATVSCWRAHACSEGHPAIAFSKLVGLQSVAFWVKIGPQEGVGKHCVPHNIPPTTHPRFLEITSRTEQKSLGEGHQIVEHVAQLYARHCFCWETVLKTECVSLEMLVE